MSRVAGVQSDDELLFVSVNVGARPAVEAFAENVGALRAFARHATFITTPILDLSELGRLEMEPRPTDVRIVRTSLNGSWECALAAPRDSSGPVGSGVACLYALHQLLQTAMSCQIQLQGIDIGKEWRRRSLVAEELDRETVRLARELVGDGYADLIDSYGSRGPGHTYGARMAVEAFGTIETVEFISLNDPRSH